MIRTFNLLTKIEMTEEQDALICSFIENVQKNDTNAEVKEILLSLADTTDGVLNAEFCPLILTDADIPSDELYEGVKINSAIIPEYVSRTEELPPRVVSLWRRR